MWSRPCGPRSWRHNLSQFRAGGGEKKRAECPAVFGFISARPVEGEISIARVRPGISRLWCVRRMS